MGRVAERRNEALSVGKEAARWSNEIPWGVSACLAAPAQIFFSPRPLTGAWVILAVWLFSPIHALSALVGLATTTALATCLRWNRLLLARGIFGLNGALVGLVWPAIVPFGSVSFWLIVPVAAATLGLQGRLLPSFTLRRLPLLTSPFVLAVWGFTLVGFLSGLIEAPSFAPPRIVGPLVGWEDPELRQLAWDSVMAMAPGAIALAAGAAISSRIVLAAALLGAAVGIGTALALGGLEGFFWVGSYGYTAAPLMVAVAGMFFPYSLRSLIAGALASGVSVLVWVGLVWLIFPLGIFPLTLPLNLVLTALIITQRSRFGQQVLKLEAIPLDDVGIPQRVSPAPLEALADDRTLSALETLIRRSSKIVVLTGAGVSTESGIPDYRSQLGFWFDANAGELTYDRFLASRFSQRLYWRLQRRFYRALELALPNQTHYSLVDLEFRGKLLGIVTQNVDGLHQRAGSSPHHVVELHGNANDVVCLGCGARFPYTQIDLDQKRPLCPDCSGLLKVDVVSIGEPIPPDKVRQAWQWCQETDLLLVLGTSLAVEPAASLPAQVAARGAPVVILNRSWTPFDAWATLVVRAPLGATWSTLDQRLAQPAGRRIRPMTRPDFLYLCQVIDAWWSDSVRYLLHPLFLEHFGDSCFVMETDDGLVGFLVGVRSQSRPGEAYVHLVGAAPAYRKQGVARALYEHFFDYVMEKGCHKVSAITVPYNSASLAFHHHMGFNFRQAGAVWQGELPVSVNYAGSGVDCVVMERQLTTTGL